MTPDPTLIEQACETPLIDLLLNVPADARMTYEHSPTHHQMIPVGKLCQQAAATLQGSAALPSDGGYVAAFYELAKMMGIGARTDAPKVVWEREMKPRILTMLRATTPTAPVQDDENRELRKIIAELGYCTPEASLEFMRLIPAEVHSRLSATPETGLVEALKAVRPFLVRLTKQGEDNIWRPAERHLTTIDAALTNTSPAQPEDAK